MLDTDTTLKKKLIIQMIEEGSDTIFKLTSITLITGGACSSTASVRVLPIAARRARCLSSFILVGARRAFYIKLVFLFSSPRIQAYVNMQSTH
jgi:hypothetical protein